MFNSNRNEELEKRRLLLKNRVLKKFDADIADIAENEFNYPTNVIFVALRIYKYWRLVIAESRAWDIRSRHDDYYGLELVNNFRSYRIAALFDLRDGDFEADSKVKVLTGPIQDYIREAVYYHDRL